MKKVIQNAAPIVDGFVFVAASTAAKSTLGKVKRIVNIKNDLNNIDIRLMLLSHGCVKSNKSFIVFLTTLAFGNN
jgi:hypothetical protein